MQSKSKRVLIAGIAGTAVFGAVVASAATLGTITTQSLGAANSVVASCDTDGVNLNFTNSAYTSPGPNYGTTSITVTGINVACNTKPIKVTLKNAANGSLAEFTGTVAAGAFTPAAALVDDELVVGSAIVIYG